VDPEREGRTDRDARGVAWGQVSPGGLRQDVRRPPPPERLLRRATTGRLGADGPRGPSRPPAPAPSQSRAEPRGGVVVAPRPARRPAAPRRPAERRSERPDRRGRATGASSPTR
jgi:hypothetical protein